MPNFDYDKTMQSLMTPAIMSQVSAVHEYRGRQLLYESTRADALERLCEVARIQSTGASNRIENIRTSEARLRELMEQKTEPRNRDEHEIVGYRYVLDLIHSSYDDIPVTPNVILQLHRDLFRNVGVTFAGHWKDTDNVIAEELANGELVERFRPPSAVATPAAVQDLCVEYRRCVEQGTYDPLLASLAFVFDFVCIHPFNDGNGRMSRLLTLLLLYKCGYNVGKYVSIEKEIEDTKSSYYDALAASSGGWDSGSNDYAPIVSYLLGATIACYKELDRRVGLLDEGGSYEDKVRRLFGELAGSISKPELLERIPGMSRATADRVLQKLQAEDVVERIGAARATRYRLRA